MREALLLALLAAGLCACNPQQRLVLGIVPADPHRTIWLDDRVDPEMVDDAASLPRLEERIDKGDLPLVLFAFDSAEIGYQFYPALDAVADWMLKHPDRKIRLVARADEVGNRTYNIDLSLRRAKSLKGYLVARGVPPPSIRFKGVGKDKPLVANDTDEHREQNRSVQLRFVDREWDSVY